MKRPVGEWDGKQMVCHDDHYFETPDELVEWADSEGIAIEDLRPLLCEPTPVPHFCMSEFLSDVLAEDQDIDGAGIDKIVNDWIAAQGVISWHPGKFRMAVMP